MPRSKRFSPLLAIVAVTSLVLSGGPVAGATPVADLRLAQDTASPTTSLSCSGAYARFFEHNDLGGMYLEVCFGTNYRNLADVSAGEGGCDGGWIIRSELADCFSSFRVYNATCHHRLSVYSDSNYESAMPSPYSGRGSRTIRSMGSYNDKMSSLLWSYVSNCPLSSET